MIFGVLLRRLRREAGLTVGELAEASGVSVRGIGDLERGRRAVPQRRTVAALVDGLGADAVGRELLLATARAGRAVRRGPAGVGAFPRGVDDFVGRREELARLAGLTGGVAVVSGAPGTGKTTLALHAARQSADRFPDGQLLVDLRGLDEDPPGPAELLTRVLKALGVPDRDLAAAGPQGRGRAYRDAVAGRRMLLVLDNARDEAQVRALLPGPDAGEMLVLVTSRWALAGLSGAHRVPLGELSEGEAAGLLAALAGRTRAEADPAGVAEVARQCGHLPLALRVAGNWLATRTGWTVRRLADRLAAEERRLGALTAGDLRVSAVFDLSYRQLTPGAARMYRRLALVEGPDAGVACAATLTGQDLPEAEDTLEELVEAGLLGRDGQRYRLHDLLRLFARARLLDEESEQETAAARAAMRRWLLETAVVAGRWFEPGHGAPPATWRGTVDLSTPELARAWLQAEDANWPAALRAAAASGEHTRVVEVAEALHWFSDQWTFWSHWSEIFATAAASARELDDPLLEATHLNYHAWALMVCEGRPQDSLPRSARALAAAERAGDTAQQAWAHNYASWAHELLHDYDTATEHIRRAAELFEAADDVHGTLQTVVAQVVLLLKGARPEEGLTESSRAFGLLARAGERFEPHIAQINRITLHSLTGRCHAALERWDEAVTHLETAIGLSRTAGNAGLEGLALVHLAEIMLTVGRREDAEEALTRCMALGDAVGAGTIAWAREHLTGLGVRADR
ncbi:ATP-binding protein [Streptomyces sp. NPDC087226]|uniref:ATP-binding protein n=1 Tax=Streptomyces sp. NPDC087226 TaxID=3365771 RepID=UPI0037F5CE63